MRKCTKFQSFKLNHVKMFEFLSGSCSSALELKMYLFAICLKLKHTCIHPFFKENIYIFPSKAEYSYIFNRLQAKNILEHSQIIGRHDFSFLTDFDGVELLLEYGTHNTLHKCYQQRLGHAAGGVFVVFWIVLPSTERKNFMRFI